MTAYNLVPASTITEGVKERKEKRRKVIEAARKLERENFLALMRKKRLVRNLMMKSEQSEKRYIHGS